MKRSPLRRRSEKQAAFEKQLIDIGGAVYERAGKWCEVMLPGICRGDKHLHIHHRRKRNVRWDGKENSLVNLWLCCHACHSYIHLNPRWAREFGFIISANADPDKVPVDRSGISLLPSQGHR